MRPISLSHSIPFLLVLLATQTKSAAQLPQPPTPLASPIVGEVRTMRVGSLQSEPKAWSDAPTPTPPPPAASSTGNPPAPVPPSALFPPYAMDDAGSWPNVYTPFTVQASWNDWLFTNPQFRGRDYANRGIWLHGAGLAGVGNPVSGVNKTRSENQVNPNEAITYNGARGQAVLTKGAPNPATRLRATGSMHLTAATFSMPKILVDGVLKYDNSRKSNNSVVQIAPNEAVWYTAGAFRGVEDFVGVSRELARLTPAGGESASGDPGEAVDARRSATREDDVWDMVPAVVKNMIGSRNVVHLDGGSTGDVSRVKIDNAVAARGAIVTAPTEGQTVPYLTGMYIALANNNKTSFLQTPSRLCGFDSASNPQTTKPLRESGIQDWAGIEIEYPNIPAGVEIDARTGVWIDDFSQGQAGGAPIQVASVIPGIPAPTGDAIIPVERSASIIARGDVEFLATGKADQALGSSDVNVYINDLLHLEPREGPPTFSSDTTAAERVGALYFDASLNRLCISVPVKTTEPALDATDSAVAWVPLDIETGGGAPTPAEIAPVRPKISLSTERHSACESVAFSLSGFSPNTTPNVYWRRPGYGYDLLGRTDWAPVAITSSEVQRTVFMSTGSDGVNPADLPSVVIQVMAVDTVTGEAAGLSFDAQESGGDAYVRVRDLILGRVPADRNYASIPAIAGPDRRVDVTDLKGCAPPPTPQSLGTEIPAGLLVNNETNY